MEEDIPKTQGDDNVQYLRRPVLEDTNIPNPIQGPVRDPNKLYHFMKDAHDSTVPKMWAIYLNDGYFSVGNEPLALVKNALPENLDLKGFAHFAAFFYAAHVILLTNHIGGDATPTEADTQLIKKAERALDPLGINLVDYVIVGNDHYWSMNVQNGTACHCGQQHYIP